MPHIPRQLAPTTGVPPEFTAAPRQAPSERSEEVAYRPPPATLSTRRFVPTLSLKRHEVPPEKIFQALYGNELVIDEHTGLVQPTSRPV